MVYFLILAAIQLLIIAFVCRRMSVDYWLSIFLFVASTDYLSWMFNGIRQFTAAVIIFSATELIIRKKYIPSVLLILLASTMHQSALIMLPVIFLIQGKAFNKKTVICVLLSVTALAFIDQFTDFLGSALADTQYKNVVSDWKSFNDDGTNPLRVLVYAMPRSARPTTRSSTSVSARGWSPPASASSPWRPPASSSAECQSTSACGRT